MEDVAILKTDWHRIMTELDLRGQSRELARNLYVQHAEHRVLKFIIQKSLSGLYSQSAFSPIAEQIRERFGTNLKIEIDAV